MTSRERSQQWWIVLLVLASVLLLIFHAWLRFGVVIGLRQDVSVLSALVSQQQTEQQKLFTPELRDLFQRLSAAFQAVQGILEAREEVFLLSEIEGERPLVLLDFPAFFQSFQVLLSKTTVIAQFSVLPGGEVSFFVQAPSYSLAAQQLEVLRLGHPQSRGSELPHLFQEVQTSSISRQALTGKAEELPEVLRSSEAVYSFAVQARMNPEFFEKPSEASSEIP